MHDYPLVSIGVPVFNGENTISDALTCLIEQDYKNLEIIISDNGSTDDTSQICKNFLKKDKRLKYYRSEENLGSIWNFNRVFMLSSGKYFLWAAHDDLREPSFVRACVEKMEQSPQAVLCQVHTAVLIENQKNILYLCKLDSFENPTSIVSRYRKTIKHFPNTAIYGLYLSSAIKKTRRFESVIATDVAFIQELSIHGNFVQVPEVLFTYVAREKWNTIDQDYKNFFGKGRKPWWYLPFIVLFCNNWSRVASAKLNLVIKLRLWWVLIEHEVAQIALKSLIKIGNKVCPEFWKERLALKIYNYFMLPPDLQIVNNDLFLERVIKPKLGWWK